MQTWVSQRGGVLEKLKKGLEVCVSRKRYICDPLDPLIIPQFCTEMSGSCIFVALGYIAL